MRQITRSIHGVGRSLLLFAVLIAACSGGGTTEDEQFDIQEAVVRWAFLDFGTDLDPPVVVCLVVGTGYLDGIADPPPSFMDRFRDGPLSVRPLSACSPDGAENPVMDAMTRGGVLFEYGPVKTGPDGEIIVTVGYLSSPGSGAVWECQVTRTSGEWQVDRCPVVVDI